MCYEYCNCFLPEQSCSTCRPKARDVDGDEFSFFERRTKMDDSQSYTDAYLNYGGTRKTPQSQPIPGRTDMVEGNAGGSVFPVDDWKRLDRFLVLGSTSGHYYASPQKLTAENADAVIRCIKKDGVRVVDRVVEVSEGGQAPNNDPALFVLAMCSSESLADVVTRRIAFDSLPRVARIGTHLYHYASFVKNFRGFGRGLRTAIAAWYNQRDTDSLAYQACKYQQRDGWSHRDLLRLSHPKTSDVAKNAAYKWIVSKELSDEMPRILMDFHTVNREDMNVVTLARIIREGRLPREAIPTKWLNDVDVWAALLENMPTTAMIRNLGKMTSIGLLAPMSDGANRVVKQLGNQTILRLARVHPISILVALTTYQQGHGVRGKLTWEPVSQIVDALDEAFYLTFDNVEPANKNTMLALDVSRSMIFDSAMIANTFISARVGSAAMALVTARTEPNHVFTIFSSGGTDFGARGKSKLNTLAYRGGTGISTIDISPRQRLDDVVKRVSGLPFGGTDCALPMLYALEWKLKIETFIVYTDSETWAGDIHPVQALQQYRQKMGIPAKLIVCGMTSGGFTIADPNDAGMLDVVGFNTATPKLINDFSRGDI